MDKFEIAELVESEHCQVRVWQARTSYTHWRNGPNPERNFDWSEKFSSLESAKAALLARPNVRFVSNKGRCGTYAYDVPDGEAEIVCHLVSLRSALEGRLKLIAYDIECDSGRSYRLRSYPNAEEK